MRCARTMGSTGVEAPGSRPSASSRRRAGMPRGARQGRERRGATRGWRRRVLGGEEEKTRGALAGARTMKARTRAVAKAGSPRPAGRQGARRERGDHDVVRGRARPLPTIEARLEAPRHRPLAERLEHLRDDDGDDGRDEPDVVAERVRGRAHGGRHIAPRGALARDEARREARSGARAARATTTEWFVDPDGDTANDPAARPRDEKIRHARNGSEKSPGTEREVFRRLTVTT